MIRVCWVRCQTLYAHPSGHFFDVIGHRAECLRLFPIGAECLHMSLIFYRDCVSCMFVFLLCNRGE